MTGPENRVVSMQFDNARFEANLATTLQSMDKLRASLDFANSTKGLDQLSAAGSRFNMGGMGTTIEGISSKFLAMATIGVTALANITNKAVEAGLQIAKSFTVEPITQGFGEYETKMGSIQTILANTARYGTQLPEVTAALDELNTYADKTIYNFGDMTRNIGLFTNAGINVKDATAMIKGFSNEAAASGTNSQGAANAAYQLSQALSAGQIRLMDWRSLTNVGMGNKNMQEGLINIANALGTVGKSGLTAKDITDDFNSSLEKGWLTSDVMSKYLKIMAGEMTAAEMKSIGLSQTQIDNMLKQQKTSEEAATKVRTLTQLMSTLKEAVGSGWSQTFEILFGNFEEATTLFTNINNFLSGIVGKSADARNSVLQGWKDLGGRNLLIESLTNVLKGLGSVLKPIQDAFREVFPKKTAQDLMLMTQAFANFAKHLKIGADTASDIRRAFAGLFAVLDIGWVIIKSFVGFIATLLGSLSGAGGGLLDLAARVGDLLGAFNNMLVNGAIQNFFTHLAEWIQNPSEFIRVLKYNLEQFFGSFASFEGVSNVVDRIAIRFDNLKGVLEAVGAV